MLVREHCRSFQLPPTRGFPAPFPGGSGGSGGGYVFGSISSILRQALFLKPARENTSLILLLNVAAFTHFTFYFSEIISPIKAPRISFPSKTPKRRKVFQKRVKKYFRNPGPEYFCNFSFLTLYFCTFPFQNMPTLVYISYFAITEKSQPRNKLELSHLFCNGYLTCGAMAISPVCATRHKFALTRSRSDLE